MMREIKFRAWDKQNKYMAVIFDSVKQEDWFIPSWKDRYEVMQYTGLKDKNGVEIYEGDILFNKTTIHQPDGKITTKAIGDIQTLKGMTYLVGKTYQDLNGEDVRISNYKCLILSPDIFETIGNIYENPELLSKED